MDAQGVQGALSYAQNVKKNIKIVCRANKAMYIGGYPMKNWEHGRYADPYMREDLDDFGIMVDTLEAGVTWDNIHGLYEGVRKFIKSRKSARPEPRQQVIYDALGLSHYPGRIIKKVVSV